jgi:5-methylcytosine-specific restriction endonuclease McrA
MNKTSKWRNCTDHEFLASAQRATDCQICKRNFYNSHAKIARIKTAAVVDAWKITQGCAICGYKEHPAALELDHIIPITQLGIRKFPKVRKDYERLIHDPNIQVLCANCHRIKTRENGEHLLRRAV